MSKIMLAGDWHGDDYWAPSMIGLTRVLGIDYLFHLGDFGIWPGDWGRRYLDSIRSAAARNKVYVFITPGNHEDYSQINALPVGAGGLQWLSRYVAIIPRGYRWEMEGRSFVSLGGAPSIDFQDRREGISWWREEMITEADVERVEKGGYADVMLAHGSPDGGTAKVQQILGDGSGWTAEGLRYAAQGREMMNAAVSSVKPRVFAHGHFHVADERDDGTTKWLSLDQQRSKKNMLTLDLETLEHRWINPWKTNDEETKDV
jgi:Icc-related predicted phosphoesterase